MLVDVTLWRGVSMVVVLGSHVEDWGQFVRGRRTSDTLTSPLRELSSRPCPLSAEDRCRSARLPSDVISGNFHQ